MTIKHINYNNKRFKSISNSQNGEVPDGMIFQYIQKGNLLNCHYSGGDILAGHLLGLVDASGVINHHYHQVNNNGDFMTGVCTSTPEILPNGKIRIYEQWTWTSGDKSQGASILEEI